MTIAYIRVRFSMMDRIKSIFIGLICCASFLANAQFSNKGTEFWVGYMAHRDASAGLYLYITSDSNTSGTVSIPGQNWSSNFTVTANSMTLVAVPPSLAHVTCTGCITDQGIKVVADKPVVVYSHIYYNMRSDATLVLPVNTTGQEYYCMAYEQLTSSDRTEFIIVANKDNTIINITPSVDLRSNTNGKIAAKQTYTITLNEGQVYQAKAYNGNPSDDITGTYIQVIDTGATASCKTVSVFSGSSWTSLGCSGSADNLYEQMYPVQSWGTRFATVPLRGVSGDNLRFLAANNNTSVIIFNATGAPTTFNLNKGAYYDLKNVAEAKFVIADKPIMVAQYSKTQGCAGGMSDPSMTIISPVEQTLTNISLYSSQYESIIDHYINVVIPTNAKNSFKVDGSTATFTAIPKYPQYSYAQIKVTSGTHYLEANEGFVATAYGFGQLESYGYAAGANVKILKSKIELKNSSINYSNNICLGQKAVLNGSSQYTVKKWVWDFGDGTSDSVQNTTHLYKDTGLYRVKMLTYKTQYDGCQVFDSTIEYIRVTGVPKAKFTHTLNCVGDVLFTNTSEAPGNEKNDLTVWNFHSGAAIYTPTAIKNYDTSGTFYVRMIARTEAWCYDTLIDSIRINPTPIAGFKTEKSCQRDSNHFVNLSTITSGNLRDYKWHFGDGDSSALPSPSHLYADSGYYRVSLQVISDSACIGIFTDSVYRYKNVTVDFAFRDTCAGQLLALTNQTDTGIIRITKVLWKTSLGDSASTYHYSPTFTNPNTVNITLVMEMDNYCVDSITKTTEVFPVQTTHYVHSSLCANDSIRFLNQSAISKGSVSVYSWDLDNAGLFFGDSVKVKFNSAGIKKITLKTISDKGCLGQVSDTFTLKDIQLTKLSFKDMCPNTSQIIKAIYNIYQDTVTDWQWTYNSTFYLGDSTLNLSESEPGKHELLLEVQTKNGCLASIKDSMLIFENPVASFSVNPVCAMADFTPKNNSYTKDNGVITAYQWTFNGNPVSTLFEPNFQTLAPGLQEIGLAVLSDKGCMDTLKKLADVFPLPRVDFTLSDTCIGQTTSFTDNSSIVSGTLTNYSWRFHDMSSAMGATATKTYPTEGVFIVTQIVTSALLCSDSISRQVTIYPLPRIDISPVKVDGCEPFTPDFKNNSSISTGVISRYDWIWGDGQSTTGFEPSHSYSNSGSYAIKIIALSDRGCTDSLSLSQNVTVYAKPVADFDFLPKQPSILESTLTFTDLSSNDVVEWDWDLGDGTTDKAQNTSHTYLDTGHYTILLKVTNGNGCSDIATKSFFINPDIFIYIPNAFTPNGDFVNDKFGVEGVVNGIKQFQMSIYNRWGERIFYTNNPNEKWDGTYLGESLSQDAYAYTIQFLDFMETNFYTKKGAVHLVR